MSRPDPPKHACMACLAVRSGGCDEHAVLDSTRNRYSHAEIRAALITCKGQVTAAARLVGCSASTVRRAMERWGTLRELATEERDLLLDEAEIQLGHAVRMGEEWAVKFALSKLGHGRGYVDRQEITGSVDVTAVRTHAWLDAALDEAGKRAMLERLEAKALPAQGVVEGECEEVED